MSVQEAIEDPSVYGESKSMPGPKASQDCGARTIEEVQVELANDMRAESSFLANDRAERGGQSADFPEV